MLPIASLKQVLPAVDVIAAMVHNLKNKFDMCEELTRLVSFNCFHLFREACISYK
jgi:hypothetical protein